MTKDGVVLLLLEEVARRDGSSGTGEQFARPRCNRAYTPLSLPPKILRMSPFSNALRLSRHSIRKNTLCRAVFFCLIFWVGAVQCQGPGRKDRGFAEQLNGGLAQQSWTIDDGLPQ